MARLKPILALAFTMLIWGVTPVFLRSISVGLGPADALVIRYVLISLACIILLLVTGKWRIARADWPRLLVISIIGIFGYSAASVYAFATVPAGVGGLIYATQPLFILLLAAIMLGERLTYASIFGLILAIAGTVLLVWDDLMATDTTQSYLTGTLLLLLACFAWSFYSVPGKVIIQRYGTLSITALSLLVGTIPMLALASSRTIDTLTRMTQGQWLELVFLAFVSSFIAMFCWTYATARLPASTIGTSLYVIPVIAVLAGAFFLGETIALTTMMGGLLILGGVAVAQFGPR
ncbi:DMT family transporter [Taklimakanibacter lacteus]|uniref:DMT family transporter n=1 Tax=Taklimakanibacter lacteus TaxID=2268456 RepID=UPI000E65EFD4